MSRMTFEEYQRKRKMFQASGAEPADKAKAIEALDKQFNITDSAAIAYEDFHASAADIDDIGN